MSRSRFVIPSIAVVAVCGLAAGTLPVATAAEGPGNTTGPSSSEAPYLVRTVPEVTLTSILTAGDEVDGYQMAGTPDGLGAWDNGNGTFTAVVGHEFSVGNGGPRSHGNNSGSFISRWVIKKRSLEVLSGEDQIQELVLATGGAKDLNRLCSADLAEQSAFYDRRTRTGTRDKIFLDGEETSGGRAFGHVVSGGGNGTSYELADLGRAAWENIAANPGTGTQTVTVGQSDGGNGNVYVYHGTKQRSGTPVDKAGLTGGDNYSISVRGMPVEDSDNPMPVGKKMKFDLAAAGSGTEFDRPEDGAWDPTNPRAYYFATTAGFDQHSRLWKLTFANPLKPEKGGKIEMVLEGPADDSSESEGPKMLDNLTVNERGQVILQEDPGGNDYLAGIFEFTPRSGALRRVAQHDPERFSPGGSKFITNNEESSGIIPAPFLGRDAYLFTDQIHEPATDPAQVEDGQLDLVRLPAGTKHEHGHGKHHGHHGRHHGKH